MAESSGVPIPQGAFKGVFDLLGRLATAKPYADSQAIVANLMEKVSSLYGDYEAMAESNAALKTELTRLKDFRREAKKYVTQNEDSGVITYRLEKTTKPEQDKHRYCPNCFLNAKISYLQPTPETVRDNRRGGKYRVHNCHSCGQNLSYDFEQDRPMPTSYRTGSSFT